MAKNILRRGRRIANPQVCRLKEAQALSLRAPILASNSPEISDGSSIDDDLDSEDDHDSIDSGSRRDERASEPAHVSPDESTTSDSASDCDCIETPAFRPWKLQQKPTTGRAKTTHQREHHASNVTDGKRPL